MEKNTNAKRENYRSKSIWIAGVAALLLVAWLGWARVSTNDTDRVFEGARAASSGYVRREKKPPLSPALFVGQTARAYQVAHEIPDILDQLYCYCECDKHLGHKSLLSCFTDDHGAG
jgi:hypothetical protein